jgi:hypothetical protein
LKGKSALFLIIIRKSLILKVVQTLVQGLSMKKVWYEENGVDIDKSKNFANNFDIHGEKQFLSWHNKSL